MPDAAPILTLSNAILASLLLGFAAGAELDLMAFLAAKYFGTAHYAKIYGFLYAGLASASGIAPSMYAWLYETMGTHNAGFQLGAVAFTASALLVLCLDDIQHSTHRSIRAALDRYKQLLRVPQICGLVFSRSSCKPCLASGYEALDEELR